MRLRPLVQEPLRLDVFAEADILPYLLFEMLQTEMVVRTDIMTNEELKAIADRANAAMRGPWQWSQEDKHIMILEQDWNRMGKRPSEAGEVMICGAEKCEACVARGARCFCPGKEDAEFIAHVREDIPNLLTEVGRLQYFGKTANEIIEKLKKAPEIILSMIPDWEVAESRGASIKQALEAAAEKLQKLNEG